MKLTRREARLAEVVLYVLSSVGRPVSLQELCMTLWLSDFTAYAKHGKAVTGIGRTRAAAKGVDYVKTEIGPIPRPIAKVLRYLHESGAIAPGTSPTSV